MLNVLSWDFFFHSNKLKYIGVPNTNIYSYASSFAIADQELLKIILTK